MTALPHFIQIEPVGQCNLRCQMCPIQFRRDGPPYGPPAFMRFELFTLILDQFPNLRELQLQGLGEPLMHPRFFDMVRYASERGIDVAVNTNLTLITPRAAERCVTSGLKRLHASLDGSTAATYERIRMRANFEKAVRNLRRIIKARRCYGTSEPYIEIVTVAMRQNLEEISNIVTLAAELGVDAMSVQHLCHSFGEETLPEHYRPMRDFVEEQTLLTVERERVDEVFAHARALAEHHGLHLRLPNVQPRRHTAETPGRSRCDWPWTGAYFSYDGWSMPCCMISTPDRVNFGNVAVNSVSEIWNGIAYESFRRQLESGDPPSICRSCSVYAGTF